MAIIKIKRITKKNNKTEDRAVRKIEKNGITWTKKEISSINDIKIEKEKRIISLESK